MSFSVNSEHKPQDPRGGKSKYNVLCRSFFCWVDPLFWLGCRRSLEFTDLYVHPPEADSSYLLNKFNKYWHLELQRRKEGRSARLLMAWFKCFWWRVIVHGLLYLLEVLGLIAQSELLGSLADYFVIDSPTSEETRNAYLYALGITVLLFLVVGLHVLNFHTSAILGLLSRIVFTSAIFQKILTLSQNTVSQLTMGHIVNLASNDIHKFDLGLLFYHLLWIGPVHVSIVTYLLYREVQWSAFVATGLLILQIPLQWIFAHISVKLRLKAARMTDKRVKIMNEVISGIRVIKMYAWEYAFRDLVALIRRSEVYAILKYFIIRAINYGYAAASTSLIMFLVFSTYINIPGAELTPRKVFVSLSLITAVRLTSIHLFIIAIQMLSDLRVSWIRIANLLLLDELHANCADTDHSEINEDGALNLKSMSSSDYANDITVQDLTASWFMDTNRPTLNDISFTVNKEKPLLAIVGTVGCGKSTLLQCLLRELPALSGRVQVRGSVGYASQEAWVFSATMRENILFGLPYDPERYNAVIDACALDKDIELFPDGDLTLVGERGVTLSGGQKARVNLARAVYRQADIYLLDDPLSAVDAAVSRHIFDRCICGLLSDKCVILVTHQIQYLQQCDAVLGLKEGGQVYGDTAAVLKEGSGIFELLANEDDDSRKVFALRKNSLDNSALESTLAHFQRTLSVVSEGNDEDLDPSQVTNATSQEVVVKTAVPAEERAHGTISFKTYYRYFIAGGGYVFTSIVILIFIITETNIVVSDWWISDWADCEVETLLNRSTCSLSGDQRIGVFAGLVGSLLIFSLLRSGLFFLLLLNSAKVVHNKMFARIIRAPILFFDTNPIGRVLNRFSKDVGFLDDLLLQVFYDYLFLLSRFLAIIITASIANPYVLIAVMVLFVVSIMFRWYYLKTARDIKRLEALARSPIYSHLSLTLQGLPTIRSYRMQEEAMNHFHRYQNQHTQAAYLYIVTNRWFGMRIDMMSALFVTFVAFVSIPLASTFNAGLLGLALTYSITLNALFQYCIRQSAEVESLMVSAERVMAYGQLDTESSLETDPSVQPGPEWPTKGHIELDNISYRHSSDGPIVLKGITCDIKPGEKIGIVGRTGAGKSSLIASLFRLAEPCGGSIKIDGVDICQLGLHDVRSKISIIPQDPVLFGGSVRYNLDPFNQYDDDRIWKALEQVQLKNVVETLEGLLDSPVSEGGTNFSVGQRQLFCLARALLQSNTILILDEATANVDLETDTIIQQVIREQFSHCTVLTIAHRLDTVMDSDRIMILRSGELIEFDVPHILLSQSSSYLNKLVEHTGAMAAERLRNMALNAYNERQQ